MSMPGAEALSLLATPVTSGPPEKVTLVIGYLAYLYWWK